MLVIHSTEDTFAGSSSFYYLIMYKKSFNNERRIFEIGARYITYFKDFTLCTMSQLVLGFIGCQLRWRLRRYTIA